MAPVEGVGDIIVIYVIRQLARHGIFTIVEIII